MNIPEDCVFYQTMELPGIGVIPGSWDHREAVDVFLGHVDFKNKSVLDVGPANGFFSFEMEKRGGQVTAVDLGQEIPWDMVPHPYLDEETLASAIRHNVHTVERAFWFAHQILNSQVELVYSSVYNIPDNTEKTDIALMSNVLQHLRDPLLAIERVAEVVKQTLVITEALWYDNAEFIDNAGIRFVPRVETPEVNHSWWQVSPSFVIELLKLLGFQEITCEFHRQRFNYSSSDSNSRMVRHFTVTAKRAQPIEAEKLEKLQITYSPDVYQKESNPKHFWRWSKGPQTEIQIENLEPKSTAVSLTFGLSSITPDVTIKVFMNGKLAWSSSRFYGVKPVFISDVLLLPGRNSVKITSTGQSVGPTINNQRILNYAVYDFTICKPFIGT